MELKLVPAGREGNKGVCFNCTFMELKFEIQRQIEEVEHVLIVPLWN